MPLALPTQPSSLPLELQVLTPTFTLSPYAHSMESPIPTVISAVHSRPKHRKWFSLYSLVKLNVSQTLLSLPPLIFPLPAVSASTLRNSKLFARGTGSTNGEMKLNGGSTKTLPSRSLSSGSATPEADASICGARPKFSCLSSEECS